MQWADLRSIDNIDFSGSEVYIEGRSFGVSLGPCSFSYETTLKPYFAGYPSKLRGYEVTSERLKISFSFLELTPNNIASAFTTGKVLSDESGDYIHFTEKSQPNIYAPVIIHKYNSGNQKHYILKVWRAMVIGSFNISYSHDTSNFIAIDVNLEALKTEGHGSDYLGIIQISDSFDITAG